MIKERDIYLFLIKSIIENVEGHEKIFRIPDEFFEGTQKDLFNYLKRQESKGVYEISSFCIEHSCSFVIDELKEIDIKGKSVDYLIDLFVLKIKNDLMNRAISSIRDNVSVDEKINKLKKALNTIEVMDLQDKIECDKTTLIKKYKEYFQENKEKIRTNNSLIGVSTGIRALDEKIYGLKNEYIIVAARPSMGKTSLILKMLSSAIYSNSIPVMFSLEMPSEQIIGRWISQLNPSLKMNNTMYSKDLDEDNRKEKDIETVLKYLSGKDFFIEDFIHEGRKQKGTMNDIINRTKDISDKLKKEDKKIGMILIDYMGLISRDERFSKGQQQEFITELSKEINNLKREYKCPVILLSQLNRDLEKREDKRPILSDLRDSGALEQDADIIMFIYRGSVYLEKEIRELLKKKPNDPTLLRELSIIQQQDVSSAEIIVGKNRNGPVGIVDVAFSRRNASFGDIDSFDDIDENYFRDMEEE